MSNEIWLPIVENPSWGFVSNYGRVKNHRGTIRKQQINSNGKGYYRVGFEGGKHTKFVARLVADAFVTGSGEVVNHKDLNPHNNHADNLEWCSYKKNTIHAFENKARGNDFRNRKLTNEDYLTAYELRQMGIGNNLLAEHFNVSKATMSKKLKRIASVGGVL